MTNHKTTDTSGRGFIPRGRSAIISLVVVAVVAFFFGGLMLGGGESTQPAGTAGDHDHAVAAESDEPTMWTCSMHPQIQLPKEGKCPICFMDLIPVETGDGGGELDPNQIRMSETAVQLAGIQTTPVTRAYAERAIRMVGKLDYDETRVSYITAWVGGRLDRLFVDYTGSRVAQGDRMVEIYSPELISAQEELLQARMAVDALNQSSSDILRTTARETLRSAREKLRLYGLSENQIQSMEEADANVENLTLTAPAGGVVVHKDATEGMYVSTGTRIYTIADLSRLWVMLEAYESDLPWLEEGQTVQFTSPSFPGETFEAEISFIDPVVDAKTRTVRVRAIVDNRDRRLKPEMFVSAEVVSRLDREGRMIDPGRADVTEEGAPLLIPASAALITGKRAIVYVRVPDNDGVVFEGREVVLGPRARDYYIVGKGLAEGDEVVTNGAFRIDSELQIQAKPSMMSPRDETPSDQPGHERTDQPLASAQAETIKNYTAGDASRLEISPEAGDALRPLYDAYFEVQMALANDDLEQAKEAYGELEHSVSGIAMSVFEGDAHDRWMRLSESLSQAAEIGRSAETIEGARDAFFHLSLAAIEMHDSFGHSEGEPYYLTYCPMARDNEGAYWLQLEDIVWNSFYGETMLRCGEIKQELPANSSTGK